MLPWFTRAVIRWTDSPWDSISRLALPQADGPSIKFATILLQAASQAAVAAGSVGLNQPGPLQMSEHGFDELGCRPEPRRQCSRFEGTPGVDFPHQLFEHGYSPSAAAR